MVCVWAAGKIVLSLANRGHIWALYKCVQNKCYTNWDFTYCTLLRHSALWL